LLLEEAVALLDLTLRLDITLCGDVDLHRRALAMAVDFALPAACDAHYLALAERLGAYFWTADHCLVQAVSGRLPWVHLLVETNVGASA